MELFDKKFVHFMWEDELEGKEGFFADDVATLESLVNLKTNVFAVKKSKFQDKPFSIKNGAFRFFYYDPNYEIKKAYLEGKQIQYKFAEGKWYDINDGDSDDLARIGLSWFDDDCEYRIKPDEPKPRRMTYRELAEWLAKGNGVQTDETMSIAYPFCEYLLCEENKEVPADYKIRRWGSDEWIEPTVDVYKADVSGVLE